MNIPIRASPLQQANTGSFLGSKLSGEKANLIPAPGK
jgi:hypothetical protein